MRSINIALSVTIPVSQKEVPWLLWMTAFKFCPSLSSVFSLQALFPSVIQPKAEVVIIFNILVKRLARRIDGDVGK